MAKSKTKGKRSVRKSPSVIQQAKQEEPNYGFPGIWRGPDWFMGNVFMAALLDSEPGFRKQRAKRKRNGDDGNGWRRFIGRFYFWMGSSRTGIKKNPADLFWSQFYFIVFVI